VVIDKGTLDAMMCGSKWFDTVSRMTQEVWSVLKVPNTATTVVNKDCDKDDNDNSRSGMWIIFSFGDDRLDIMYGDDDWDENEDEEESVDDSGTDGEEAKVSLASKSHRMRLDRDWSTYTRYTLEFDINESSSVFVTDVISGGSDASSDPHGLMSLRETKKDDSPPPVRQKLYLYVLVKRPPP